METTNEGTLKKSIYGGAWMTANTIIQRVISVLTFFVLARLLTPEDFGIIAIVLLVPPILDLVFTIDFDTALIRSREENPRLYYDALWTINVCRSFIIFILVFLFGDAISTFFHLESAALAIKLGGIFVLIQGFGNVAQIMFSKEMDFKKIFIRDMLSRSAYACIAIFFAWHFHSYWALFWANIGLYGVSVISAYILYPYRPSFTAKWQILKHFLGYSKWLYGQGILGELSGTIENTVIGRTLGVSEVGLYTRAKALAITPTSPIMSIINKVSFPAYARIQDSSEKVKSGYLKSLDILMFVGIPFVVLTLAASKRMILIALGQQWVALDVIFKILVVATVFQMISSLSSAIFNALGHPSFQLFVGVSHTIIVAVLILVLTSLFGAPGTATAVLIAAGIISALVFYKTNRLIGISAKDIASIICTPLIASMIVLIIGEFILLRFVALGDIAFIVFVGALGVFYTILIWLGEVILNVGPYKTLYIIWSEMKSRYS